MQSKASRNQLNLPQGTKTKPDMLKNGEQPESIESVRKKREDLWWEGFVKEVNFLEESMKG